MNGEVLNSFLLEGLKVDLANALECDQPSKMVYILNASTYEEDFDDFWYTSRGN